MQASNTHQSSVNNEHAFSKWGSSLLARGSQPAARYRQHCAHSAVVADSGLLISPSCSMSLLCQPARAAHIPAGLTAIASLLVRYYGSFARLPLTHKHLPACKEDIGQSQDCYGFTSIPHDRLASKTAPFRASQSPAYHEENTMSPPLLTQASCYRRSYGRCVRYADLHCVCVCAYNSSKHSL
jgi:hypothetical protein